MATKTTNDKKGAAKKTRPNNVLLAELAASRGYTKHLEERLLAATLAEKRYSYLLSHADDRIKAITSERDGLQARFLNLLKSANNARLLLSGVGV